MITIERVAEVFGFTCAPWRVGDYGGIYCSEGYVLLTPTCGSSTTRATQEDQDLCAIAPQLLHALIESQIHDDKLFGGVDTDYIKIIESADRQKRLWPELRVALEGVENV